MSNTAANFWHERLARHGHTGWSDPILYAYDQRERLIRIRNAVKMENITYGCALDFGCGSGDFSLLLSSFGFKVCGYDPYVRPCISISNFSYAASLEDITLDIHTADIVLCVTTLDHILDEGELHNALMFIRSRLKQSGVCLMLEYALDSEDQKTGPFIKSNYQSFRTLAQWTEILGKHSLRITGAATVPHPKHAPSCGYLAYAGNPLVRLYRRIGNRPRLAVLLNAPLRWTAAYYSRKSAAVPARNAPSPLKLIRCIPS